MKVTIITAVWNGAKTIGSAQESVRRQVLPAGVELEHIVVDGGSTDGTVRIIKDFEQNHCSAFSLQPMQFAGLACRSST